MEALLEGIEKAGYTPGKDIYVGMDVASSEFYSTEKKLYTLTAEAKPEKTADELIAMYADWAKKYPLISIEDGLAENDWDGWKNLTQALGDRMQLVGDDIFVTNTSILKEGIAQGIGNSILVKLNQIGSLTETIDVIEIGRASCRERV